MERKIYECWFCHENWQEERDINLDIYKELKEKYKITCTNNIDNCEEFDIIYSYGTPGYAHTKYHILRNRPNLKKQELALIIDYGNLCFGFRGDGNEIIIHED